MKHRKKIKNKSSSGISLAVQWLGLDTFTAMGLGLIPGWGTKISQTLSVCICVCVGGESSSRNTVGLFILKQNEMYILQSTSLYLNLRRECSTYGNSERNIKDFNELATPNKTLDLEPANLGPVPW